MTALRETTESHGSAQIPFIHVSSEEIIAFAYTYLD